MILVETISAIGAFTALSNADADYLALDPDRCNGVGDPPQRTTVQAAPGADGALILPTLDDAWIVTLAGDLVVTSTGYSSEAGYRAAVDTLYESLRAAVNAMKPASGSLMHSGGTIAVWKYGPVDPAWQGYHVCSVTFSLIVDVLA